jgi:hypothetical protein
MEECNPTVAGYGSADEVLSDIVATRLLSQNAKVVQGFDMAGLKLEGLAVESLGLGQLAHLMALDGGDTKSGDSRWVGRGRH